MFTPGVVDMRVAIAFVLCLFPLLSPAQLKSLKVETLPLERSRSWSQPRWSPDGKTIFFTASDFDGIWAYSRVERKTVQITSDRGSGYGFSISDDGARIAWRRTLSGPLPGERLQEAVLRNIADGTSSVLASGKSISLPSFVRSDPVYSVGNQLQGVTAGVQPAGTVAILGIEETKIAILRDGVKSLIDPLGNGSYLWPSLSPDGSKLVACEMDRGTFVAGPDGSHAVRIGRRDAPVWTRDGRWLMYMADKDDGHAIRSSGIAYVSPDGKVSGKLTSASRGIEMFPQCSPVADAIVCSTLEGEIFVITYSEVSR
jgi:Tol biopolymer transport system component